MGGLSCFEQINTYENRFNFSSIWFFRGISNKIFMEFSRY